MIFRELLYMCLCNMRFRLGVIVIFAIVLICFFCNIKYLFMASQDEPMKPYSSELVAPKNIQPEMLNAIPTPNETRISTESHVVISRSVNENVSTKCPTSPPKYYIVTYSTTNAGCKMYSCFNHSKCPFADGFHVFLHDYDTRTPVIGNHTTTSLREILSVNNLITTDKEKACVYFVLLGEAKKGKPNSKPPNSNKVTNKMANTTQSTTNFTETGHNYVLCNLAHGPLAVKVGGAILAQSTFTYLQFRHGYDVIIPPVIGHSDVWLNIPPVTGAKRKYLLSFQGKSSKGINKKMTVVINVLKNMAIYNHKTHIIQFNCKKLYQHFDMTPDDWFLCDDRQHRRKILQDSTFALIIIPTDNTYVSSTLIQTRLLEALESGAIPVILGGDRIQLPFAEVLDWRKAVISLPMTRVTELKILLKTISYEDILAFRRQGRLFWERYLGSLQAILDTLLATIRSRINISPKLAPSLAYKYTQINKIKEKKPTKTPSRYKRKYTVGLINGYDQWNVWGDPFILHPQLPWDPIMTPESRFENASILNMFGDNCMDLSGDHPIEQFTIVILTYERATLLLEALNKISDIPYLNKILIIFNSNFNTSTEQWPQFDVPVITIRLSRNSLSNRFLPYNLVETEAVLYLDDDFVLTTKEIISAFKIWREHRDQIVGFYGRHYALDKKNKEFKYRTGFKVNNNQSSINCGISIISGAAFIHRYYLWAYWRLLPHPIRSFVDKHMNCEDLAMNFLVSHITRKPPVLIEPVHPEVYNGSKIPQKQFPDRNKYYEHKHKCLQYFTKVMGYNPLLTTHLHVKTFSNTAK